MFSKTSEVNISEITNEVLIEYFSIRKENPDCIMLYQIGTFWETLFEDAKILSSLSGMVLSKKCGFVKNFGYEVLKK